MAETTEPAHANGREVLRWRVLTDRTGTFEPIMVEIEAASLADAVALWHDRKGQAVQQRTLSGAAASRSSAEDVDLGAAEALGDVEPASAPPMGRRDGRRWWRSRTKLV